MKNGEGWQDFVYDGCRVRLMQDAISIGGVIERSGIGASFRVSGRTPQSTFGSAIKQIKQSCREVNQQLSREKE